MSKVSIKNVGAFGVNKDLSAAELPPNAWTDASNIRFLDGMAMPFYGQGEVYSSPAYVPQYVMPCSVASARYWIYTTATKTFAVTITGGVAVHTDITHATPRAGVVNAWSGCVFGGVPILNTGDVSKVPMYWDQDLTHKFVDLTAWPAGVYCKALRQYKQFLIALGLTKAGVSLPYTVKWSSPAVPGAIPSTWNEADATNDAGETDLAEGQDIIIDGLALRDSFMIYKEASIWRMDYVGGQFVFRFSKVMGTSGAMNRNCIAELDGFHLVLTGSDVIYHDGQNAVSVLDKQTRRYLFQNIDVDGAGLCFVFKNVFFNEVFVCYPAIGSTSCDRAMVYNYVDKTVAFREMPNLNHAAFGPVDNGLAGTWSSDSAPWQSDLSAWGGPDFVPSTARTIMASANQKLYMMDSSASFDGLIPNAYLERRGLAFEAPDRIKMVRGILPRITGAVGETVLIQIGASDDPYADPVYGPTMTHTIGTTVRNDCFVSGRYIAVRFSVGTAYQFRLDSYDLDIVDAGAF